jgi:serine/threonine-protein kinase
MGSSSAGGAYGLKLLRSELHGDIEALKMLHRETFVGRLVAHPRLVSIVAASLRQPPYFVVMPWLEGHTLAALLSRGAPLDVPTALWIARQTAAALEALDAAGWNHGDVKPENIIVSPEGHATLIDLGSARSHDECGSSLHGALVGTGRYLAPETAMSALRADVRSDIYSLGVVLYEMFAGGVPFDAKTLGELIDLHREAPPPRLRAIAPQTPREVATLVHRMLAKDPLRRPQNARELIDELARLEIDTFAERVLA